MPWPRHASPRTRRTWNGTHAAFRAHAPSTSPWPSPARRLRTQAPRRRLCEHARLVSTHTHTGHSLALSLAHRRVVPLRQVAEHSAHVQPLVCTCTLARTTASPNQRPSLHAWLLTCASPRARNHSYRHHGTSHADMHTRAGRKAKILALPNQADAHARTPRRALSSPRRRVRHAPDPAELTRELLRPRLAGADPPRRLALSGRTPPQLPAHMRGRNPR